MLIHLNGGSVSIDNDGTIQPHDYSGWYGPGMTLIGGIGFLIYNKKKDVIEEIKKFFKDINVRELKNLHSVQTAYWLSGGNNVHFQITGQMGSEGMSYSSLDNELYELNNNSNLPPEYEFTIWSTGKDLAEEESDNYLDEINLFVDNYLNNYTEISINELIDEINDWYENDDIIHTIQDWYELIQNIGFDNYKIEFRDKNNILINFECNHIYASDKFKEKFLQNLKEYEINQEEHKEIYDWAINYSEPDNEPFKIGELVRNIQTGAIIKVCNYMTSRDKIVQVIGDTETGFVLQYEHIKEVV